MSALSEILDRFRRAWSPPGAPAPSGAVPEDLLAELRTELRPLFLTIDGIEDQAEMIRRDQQGEVARIQQGAVAGAERLLSEARRQAPTLRAQVAATRRQADASGVATVLADAELACAGIGARARGRQARLIEQLVFCALTPPVMEVRGDVVAVGRG